MAKEEPIVVDAIVTEALPNARFSWLPQALFRLPLRSR